MEPENKRKESNNLAERLRELYQIYNCENELPSHDDLVAKLEQMKPSRRETIRSSLDQGIMYPIDSYKKAEEIVNRVDKENEDLEKFLSKEIIAKAPDKLKEDLKEYCGLMPKKKQPKEERVNQFMEFNKNFARKYFEVFKGEVQRYLVKV